MGSVADVAQTLRAAGGVATYRWLRRTHSCSQLARALDAGLIVRLRRGRYADPRVEEQRALAHQLTAVRSHLRSDGPRLERSSGPRACRADRAAEPPGRALRRRPRLDPLCRDQPAGMVTRPDRPDPDRSRLRPHPSFAEALAVADSAVRAEDVSVAQLRAGAARLRGPGATAARRVAQNADGRAANPMESVLRAIALEIPGFTFTRSCRSGTAVSGRPWTSATPSPAWRWKPRVSPHRTRRTCTATPAATPSSPSGAGSCPVLLGGRDAAPGWVGWAIAAVGERRAGRGAGAADVVRAVHANVQ